MNKKYVFWTNTLSKIPRINLSAVDFHVTSSLDGEDLELNFSFRLTFACPEILYIARRIIDLQYQFQLLSHARPL